MGTCKSSTEEVPLQAKPAINFQDAVFYYPSEQTADDDDNRRGLAHVLSEGRVPAATATACCSSDDRLPLKEAFSVQPVVGDDMPLMAGKRRHPSMLRRMRAFFGRSSSSTGTAQDEMARAGRQLSDGSMMTPVGWNELDEGPTVHAAIGGVAAEDPGAARPARSCTSPTTRYFDGGESKTEHGTTAVGLTKERVLPGTESLSGPLMSEAAAGEQPCDVKNNDEQLVHPFSQTVPDAKP